MAGPIRGGAYIAANPFVGGFSAKQVALDTLHPDYPYSLALSGAALVVRGTGPIIIFATCTVQSGITCTAQLRINGSTVATGNAAQASNIVYRSAAARQGDLLTLWETDTGNQFAHRISPGASSTFIVYEPIGIGGRSTTTPAVQRASLY